MLDISSLTDLLTQPQKIVITMHHKPDGDAMGSSLGLYNYLIQQGHHVQVIAPTDYPDFLSWMPGNEEVIIYTETEQKSAELIAEGDCVVGRWEGGGTHTGPAFDDFLVGGLPPATGRKMHFTGTTVLRLKDGKIVEEKGLDDGVTALTQLGLIAVVA